MTKKKSKRNRSKNFVAIPFSMQIPLSTLADATVIQADILGSALGEDLFVISIDAMFTLKDLTAGEVPLQVGFSHSDLSVGEVNEALNAELTDPDDIIQKERARRPVRRAGTFNLGSIGDLELADGVPQRTKMKFSVGDGHNISAWLANKSGATLTTGAIMHCNGTIYGRWQR